MCGGRIFPEAATSVSFLQHDSGEYLGGIEALEAEYPQFVKVRTFSEMLGREVLSAGGREIYMIEITDFSVDEAGKVPVAVSLSVHGPERAGIEGGIRYAEDLASWGANDPEHELCNGTEEDSVCMSAATVLDKVHLYLSNMNPDGWSRGDLANGGVFMRGNANGTDLNRQFPTKGWTQVGYQPETEPETNAWIKLMERIEPAVAADLHGELTSANDAFADIMYPAGQWDPLEQAQEERLARHMTSNVARYFEAEGVVIEDVTGVAGMVPAQYATAYDVVGYDDSGFMGDFFTERIGANEMDVEHFASHIVPNSTWSAPLEQAHIASVRAEIETLIVESMVQDDVRVRLNFGRTGYLFDPAVVTDRDGYGGPRPPKGYKPLPYRATRMRYFKDLSRYSTSKLRKVLAADVGRRGLRGLDTFVISDNAWPRDARGRRVSKAATVKALRSWVRAGGNLVLTDGALKLLAAMKVVAKDDIARDIHNAGHVDVIDFDHAYLRGVHVTASQTYYEVPLGYSVDVDSSPHWSIADSAWNGDVAATVTDETRVALGRMKLGKGTIGIIGALLPKQTEKFDHIYGIADYAVTVAGGQILNNMIALGR